MEANESQKNGTNEASSSIDSGNLNSTQSDDINTNLNLLFDIDVSLSIELGTKKMLIKDILNLGKNSVIELDKSAGEPLDIKVNGNLIARGEVVVVNDKYGVRLTEVVNKSKRMEQIER